MVFNKVISMIVVKYEQNKFLSIYNIYIDNYNRPGSMVIYSNSLHFSFATSVFRALFTFYKSRNVILLRSTEFLLLF